MSIDYDGIIKKSLEQIFHDIDLERTTVISAVTGNVDILMNKSRNWFGSDVPEEYQRVIRSLFTITAFLVEKQKNSDHLSIIKVQDHIRLSVVIRQIVRDLMEIFDYGSLSVSMDFEEEEPSILTSEQLLKESIYNIFFSLYPFMNKDSSCDIVIKKDNYNVFAEFYFNKLKESFPGHGEIKKRLFSYNQNNEEKIGIGIDSAINSLRTIGSIVKVDTLSMATLFSMNIMFPTTEFMEQVERVREVKSCKAIKPDKGRVLAVVNDPMMRLLLGDVIAESGYKLSIVSVKDFKDLVDLSCYKALVFDFSNELFTAGDYVKKINNSNHHLILIHGEKDFNADDGIFNSFKKLKKPFNVDSVIDYIESKE
ncbi:MAG: hypothetical protein WDA74_02195 [Spirochaetota bacterium]